MKLTIKDIFTPLISEQEAQKPITVDQRMIQLSKALEQKDIVLKEEVSKVVDENELQKDIDRIKEIARLDEWNSVNQYSGHIPTVLGLGQTVNSFMEKKGGQTVNTFLNINNNPNANNIHNPNYTYLSDEEAFRLAISRTLNSGDPTVTKLGLYEEVNQVLNELGFLAKSPLMIKQMIIKMIND